MKKTKRHQMLIDSEKMGFDAYESGTRAAAQDGRFLEMISNRKPGELNSGEPTTTELLKSWSNGNNQAHRKNMKALFGF